MQSSTPEQITALSYCTSLITSTCKLAPAQCKCAGAYKQTLLIGSCINPVYTGTW